jgi:hypothetical protein
LRLSRARRHTRRRIFFGVALVAVLGAIGAVVAVVTNQPPAHFASLCTVPTGTKSASGSPILYSITPEQAQNASIIAAVSTQKGLPDHAVTVALATALQESQLLNLRYGDRDSLGLFQQRPSQGWGTPAQIEDPVYAASVFYDHLVRIQGWQAMPVTEAAQLVQLSASPDAYARWGSEAQALAIAFTGEQPEAVACHLDGFGGVAPSSSALAAAAATELGPPSLGVPVTTQRGWQVAAWAVAHAYNYHVTSVSFDGRLWTPSLGSWDGAPDSRSVVAVTP